MKGNYRPAGATQTITTSGTSAATSNGVGAQVSDVLITASQDCYIAFGAAPTATATNGVFLLKDWPTYFSIHGGEKVAALQVSTGGTVYVSELTR
ncbi:MAG: hypothetical protein ACPHEP_08120 [Acidimicrobiales bacterium]